MQNLTSSDASNLFRRPPERFIDVGEGEVAYRKVGSGPDVLFVHGWPVSGATFRHLLPSLSKEFTCHVIDLVGAGQSRFDKDTQITIPQHIQSLRRVAEALELSDFAVVGHDSGGMMARHAFANDPRLRAMGLVNTEQPQGLAWPFRRFLLMSKVPRFADILGWAVMQPRLRKHSLLLGECFNDRSLLDGEFEEFFLAPLHHDAKRRWAAGQLARSFDTKFVLALGEIHRRINVPVQLVWGEDDPFFPLEWTREMVSTFSNAALHVVPKAKLFCHEEHPDEVADALRPTLLGASYRAEATQSSSVVRR